MSDSAGLNTDEKRFVFPPQMVPSPRLHRPAYLRFGQSLEEYVEDRYLMGQEFYRRKIREFEMPCEGRVLDVGCGPGQWAAVIAEDNPRTNVVACDRNEFLLGRAKDLKEDLALANLSCVQGDIYELPFDDASFDTTICVGVLQLVRVKDAMSEICRVTRPGGTMFLSMSGLGFYLDNCLAAIRGRNWKIFRQNFKFIWRTWRRQKNKPFTYFSPRRVRRLAADYGLGLLYARAAVMYPPRSKETLLGRPVIVAALLRKA